LTLYAASSDGTVGAFHFDPEELEGLAPHSAQEQYLQKFGFIPPPLPEGFSHHSPVLSAAAQQSTEGGSLARTTPPPSPKGQDRAQPSRTGFGQTSQVNGNAEHVNHLVAKRGNKKRIRPISMNKVPSAAPLASEASSSSTPYGARFSPLQESRYTTTSIAPPTITTKTTSKPCSPTVYSNSTAAVFGASTDSDYVHGTDVLIDSLDVSVGKRKRKAGTADLCDDQRPSKPRTLGGDRPREAGVVRVLGGAVQTQSGIPAGAVSAVADLIPVPVLVTYLNTKVKGHDEDIFEGRNYENNGQSPPSL